MYLTNKIVGGFQPKAKPYDIRDSELKGFLVRIHPSGKRVYYLDYRDEKQKRQRYCIGTHGTITAPQARAAASIQAGKVALGENVQQQKKLVKKEHEANKNKTLRNFLTNKYEDWLIANQKRGDVTIKRLKLYFAEFLDKPLDEIGSDIIEPWRTKRVKDGISKISVNREVSDIKALLSRAVDWGVIKSHPLLRLKPLKAPSNAVVRYLDASEAKLLRAALDDRDNRIRIGRENHNEWCKERGYELLPIIPKDSFADHLKPMTLLVLNTGLRRGELFNLTWNNINLVQKILTVTAQSAKNSKTRHISLNSEAMAVIKKWKKYSEGSGFVFPSKDGERFNNIKKSWKKLMDDAGIKKFRFHDLRHDFASKLVMAGVDLYTVKELMGHSKIEMTMRYAHLAPEHKANAVEKLIKGGAV